MEERNYTDTVDLREFKWEYRKRKVIDFFKSIPERLKYAWDNHKEEIIFFSPAVAFGVKKLFTLRKDKRDDFHRDQQVYDRSLGMYHTLKRPMRTDEKIEFDLRRKRGESVLSILRSMGLLR